jgi:RNA polymerase sigma-70 factor (ECF subfamily)
MDEREWLAEEFDRQRPHLQAVAYRMLGSVSEAEDAVQESWLRLSRSDTAAVENLRAWLTTVVSRVALDALRARRARREEAMGSWIPEPVVTLDDDSDPEQQALLADGVGLALLVVLEQLQPAERLAFVLHDMFGVPFDDIARILERSPAAARQLASRGRRRVRGAAPTPDPDVARQREVVDAFLAAARSADFGALVAVLDPDVVFRTDTGEHRPRPLVRGANAVAREVLERGARFAGFARPATVNGAAGLVVAPQGRPFAILGCTVVDGRIAELDLVLDARKVRAALGIGHCS